MADTLTLASRGSALALWQAEHVRDRLQAAHSELEVRILEVSSTGDQRRDVPLHTLGGKGLFVKELEEALLDGRADAAVHSLKDVPSDLPEGFVLAAVPERADPRDAWLSRHGGGIAGLPEGACVGTASLRRAEQLRHLRDDLRFELLRGNVGTRIAALDDGRFDAIVLACAGLDRLGLADRISERLPTTQLLPAVGQGALGLECRADDPGTVARLAAIEHGATRRAVGAEREVCRALGASCTSPLGVYARLEGEGELRLTVRIANRGRAVEAEGVAPADGSRDLDTARSLAEDVLARGGRELLHAE